MRQHREILFPLLILIASANAGATPGPERHVVVSNGAPGTTVSAFSAEGVSHGTPLLLPAGDAVRNSPAVEEQTGSALFDWQLKFSASGKVFKDVSFASALVGYIATELGAVYKTTNGGESWQLKLNLGFPYYWYGIDAISPDTVVISGFNNQGNISDGVVRWSTNGGTTWSSDIVLSVPAGVGWLDRVHFFGPDTGIVMAGFSGGAHVTTTGGRDAGQWTYVQINSDLGWFAGNIDAQPPGHVFATGIHFAHSSDFGMTWTSAPSVDGVFDGGVDFLEADNLLGLTGGGQISAPVQGWLHRTSDGGASWSGRLETFPYPIRTVRFLSDSLALAAGGNVFDESGGIYTSLDGGLTWTLDVQTDAEMFSIEVVRLSPDSVDVWCAGSTGGSTGYTGRLYRARIALPSGTTHAGSGYDERPLAFDLLANYPNPFNGSSVVTFRLPSASHVTLRVFDILGHEVARPLDEWTPAGESEVRFDASLLPSGVYFYQINWSGRVATRKMVLMQ
jgi:photosystem II stability/assembly factor-like uncharacterized protein